MSIDYFLPFYLFIYSERAITILSGAVSWSSSDIKAVLLLINFPHGQALTS